MPNRVFLWLALLAVASSLAAVARAQRPEFVLGGLPEPPRVLSGVDIGFQMDGIDSAGNATGAFVVRIDNRWVEVRPRAGFPTR